MKVKAKYYREIEYVVVSELPDNQQIKLREFKEADYIKILMDGVVTGPCLQYNQYSTWYADVYSTLTQENAVRNALPVKNLAWEKS